MKSNNQRDNHEKNNFTAMNAIFLLGLLISIIDFFGFICHL
jgi:hypothetical protein